MPRNLEALIITAAEYKIVLNAGGVIIPLFSLESFDINFDRESKTIYAIGQEEPIGTKRNAAKYTGSIGVQVGEIMTALKLLGLVEPTQISGGVLAFASLNPLGLQCVFESVNINSGKLSVKSQDKDSIVNLSWEAISVSGFAV
jgi:hypothetical protein